MKTIQQFLLAEYLLDQTGEGHCPPFKGAIILTGKYETLRQLKHVRQLSYIYHPALTNPFLFCYC